MINVVFEVKEKIELESAQEAPRCTHITRVLRVLALNPLTERYVVGDAQYFRPIQ